MGDKQDADVAFESAKHIYRYRTPVTLQAYSDLALLRGALACILLLRCSHAW